MQSGSAHHTYSPRNMGNTYDHRILHKQCKGTLQCHQVYITNTTKHIRTCKIVFFKHKYLTMPSITPGDTLLKAADNLMDTITGQLPRNSSTTQAVEQIMDIFKVQAEKATCKSRSQRILHNQAQAQRVLAEAQRMMTNKRKQQASTPINIPDLETEEIPNQYGTGNQQVPMISQDDNNDNDYVRPPLANS
jgi:hypothetical protein